MPDETVSPETEGLGYTGCEVYRAERIRRDHAVKKLGKILTLKEAVDERQSGRDVVVCGTELRTNLLVAEKIESAATGNCHQLHRAHVDQGERALSHFQHRNLKGKGHTFFESPPERLAVNGTKVL